MEQNKYEILSQILEGNRKISNDEFLNLCEFNTIFCSGSIDSKLPHIYINLHKFGLIKNPRGSVPETPLPLVDLHGYL